MESRQICRLLLQVWVLAPGDLCLPTGDSDSTMGNYLDKNSRSLRRHERRPSYAHTAAPVLGPRAITPGVAATTGALWSTCLLLRAYCSIFTVESTVLESDSETQTESLRFERLCRLASRQPNVRKVRECRHVSLDRRRQASTF